MRDPIAQAVGVKKDQWAAAVGLPAGCLWLELSILRGALQGVGDYRSVGLSLIGEQGSRLIFGAAPIPFSIPDALRGQILVGDFIYSKYRLLMLAVAAPISQACLFAGPCSFVR